MVEILQNCVIFNDKAHGWTTERSTQNDHQLRLEHGKPMIFGEEGNKGIRMNGFKPEIVTIGEDGVTEADILVHDETDENIAYVLTKMRAPEVPTPLGVFRAVAAPVYNDQVHDQVEAVREKKGEGSLEKLLFSGDTWEVKGDSNA